MATIKVMLHKNWKHKSGTYPVVFQILHGRKKKILYTGYKVFETDFDEEKQKVFPKKGSGLSIRSARMINRDIKKRHKILLAKIAHFEAQGIEYSASDLDENPVRQYNVWFLKFMREQIALKRETENEGIADAYESTLNSFSGFLKGKDLKVAEITSKLINYYGDYLRGRKLSDNTIAYYMRNLKTVYNRALDNGFKPTCAFPFKTAKTGISRTPKRAITREILIGIIELELDPVKEEHLILARDIFMFSYYCRGTSFVDIIHLKKSAVAGGAIVFARQKGKQPIRVAVIPQLEELMEKYSNDTEYVFSLLKTGDSRSLYKQYKLALQRINYGLNIIGGRIGLDYPLTTYMARHTWATLVKNLGTPVSVISEGLGHTSERTTRIYLKEFDTSVLDKVNEEVAKLK